MAASVCSCHKVACLQAVWLCSTHASSVRVQVANLPLVQGVPVPKELFEIDQVRR